MLIPKQLVEIKTWKQEPFRAAPNDYFLIILLAFSPIDFDEGSPFWQWQCVASSAGKKKHSWLLLKS